MSDTLLDQLGRAVFLGRAASGREWGEVSPASAPSDLVEIEPDPIDGAPATEECVEVARDRRDPMFLRRGRSVSVLAVGHGSHWLLAYEGAPFTVG